MPRYRLPVPATPESLGEVRDCVAGLAEQAGISNVRAVRMCVLEAVSNAIMHACDNDLRDHVDVAVSDPEPGALWVTVTDTGSGFKPRADSPGLGLGLPLIAKLATHLDIGPNPGGGTTLYMEFRDAELRSRHDAVHLSAVRTT